MDLAYYYELWRGMMLSADPAVADAVAWWQEFYVKFYMAFIEADRWKQYLDGIGTTLTATALALVLGVVLGILVALVRTAHDQQRADRRRNPFLGLFNGTCSSFITLVTAEMLGAKYGIGWYINWQKEMMAYANVYTGLIIIAVTFFILITLLFKFRDRVLAWQKGVIKW